MDSKQEANEVKRLNLGRIGHRYIEILDSNENEYSLAKNSLNYHQNDHFLEKNVYQDQSNEMGVLRCRGLPYHTGEMEMETFFEDYKIAKDGIKIVYQKDGKHSG